MTIKKNMCIPAHYKKNKGSALCSKLINEKGGYYMDSNNKGPRVLLFKFLLEIAVRWIFHYLKMHYPSPLWDILDSVVSIIEVWKQYYKYIRN